MAGVGLFARQPAETLSLIAGGREGGHQGLSSVKSRGRLASTARGRRHHQHNRTPRDTRTQHLAPASPRAATAARSALRTGQRPLTQALFGAFFLCSHMAVNMCYRPQESVYHPAGANTHTPRRTQTPHDSVISPQPTMVSFGACFEKKTFFVFWQARSAIWIPVGRRGPGFRVCINQ